MTKVIVDTMSALATAMATPAVEEIIVRGSKAAAKVAAMDRAGLLMGKAVQPLARNGARVAAAAKGNPWAAVAAIGIVAVTALALTAIFTRTKLTMKWKISRQMEGEIILVRDYPPAILPTALS